MTLTLTPENFGTKIGDLYSQMIESDGLVLQIIPQKSGKKRFMRTQKNTKVTNTKTFRERMEDPSNTSYGPFEGEEAIDFLKSQMV